VNRAEGRGKQKLDKAIILFEDWWNETGRYLDPDTDDVPWFDKRKELAGIAYMAGYEKNKEINKVGNRRRSKSMDV